MAAQERSKYPDRIVTDPHILVGKPTIKGTRIAVESILGQLADNLNVDELLEAYPDLTVEDVKASLAYARAVVGAKALPATTMAQQGITMQELLAPEPAEDGVPLREYSREQIAQFLADDTVTDQERAIVKRFDRKRAHSS